MQSDNLIDRQLGDFVVRERIGQGGMATVYRAHQNSMKRDVALKVIDFSSPFLAADFKERFAQESEFIASLEHLHILPVYDYGIQDDIAFLAMRLLPSGDLGDLIRNNPLSEARIAALFSQIAQGLAYAHSQGIIHRDLKPGNIMLDNNNNAFLTDFGLAKMVRGAGTDMTKTGNIVGTLAYMSPEQLKGDPLDHRSDIYSLGVILYYMACGRTPFQADSSEDIVSMIYKHLEETPEAPSSINASISPELEKVIVRSLQKNPEARYNSAGEMAKAVKNAVGATLSTGDFPAVNSSLLSRAKASDVSRTLSKKTRESKKNGLLIAGVLVAAVIVIGLILFAINNNPVADIPIHKVLAGEVEQAENIVPTDEQIRLARQKLGEDGFIAIIACNLSSEFHATLNREIAQFAAEYDLRTKVYDSNSDTYTQQLEIGKALIDGALAFILCGLDFEFIDLELLAIEEAHLPLVIQGQPDNPHGGVMISNENENYRMGLLAGRYVGQLIRDELNGQANVITLDFPDLDTIIERANGLEHGLLEFAPDANLIGRYLGATQENALESVGRLLEDGSEFDVIISINDAGSYGAIEAMEVAEIDPSDVIISSIDAERLAVNYIKEGRFIRGTLSLELGRVSSARASVDVITQMLAGATVPENIRTLIGSMITSETLADAAEE